MSDDLIELKERIEIARAEIEDLARNERAFFSKHVQVRGAREGDRYEVFAKADRAVPTALKAKAGTIANELRSCLDGLACALAVRNNKTMAGTYFPISKSEDIFNADGKQKMRKLGAVDQTKIEALKPYRGGNPTLFGLHEADRTRKHQRLIMSTARSQGLNVGGMVMSAGHLQLTNCVIVNETPHGDVVTRIPELNYEASELVPGSEVRLITGSGNPPQLSPEFAIAYDEPPELQGLAIVSTLDIFANAVEAIVSAFD